MAVVSYVYVKVLLNRGYIFVIFKSFYPVTFLLVGMRCGSFFRPFLIYEVLVHQADEATGLAGPF